jgi:glycerol-3-phosphate acyltransferase PlsY
MQTWMLFVMCGLGAYMLGAIPFGYLICKARGVDIRSMGSGNIGATNVLRSVGKPWGVLTFICDFLKGLASALLIPLAAGLTDDGQMTWLKVICALLAVAGHNWPVYLRFKGGKGIATSAGGIIGIAPSAVGIGAVLWILLFLSTRYVSAASIAAAVAIAVSGWVLYAQRGPILPTALTMLAALAVWRHKTNIMRLIKGEEHRFERKGHK